MNECHKQNCTRIKHICADCGRTISTSEISCLYDENRKLKDQRKMLLKHNGEFALRIKKLKEKLKEIER